MHKVVTDRVESIGLVKERLLLNDRGDLPLMRLLDQAYELPNAIGLEVSIGDRMVVGIKKLDKALERRFIGLLRGLDGGTGERKQYKLHLRIVALIG